MTRTSGIPGRAVTAATLRRNAWFARLTPELQAALLDEAQVKFVAPGKWLYGSGDAPRGVFAVLEGAGMVYVGLPRGEDALVHVATPGEIFGHAARLGRGPRLATVIAAEPSVFAYLPEAALDRVGERHPELWPSLTRLLYEQLGALLALLAQSLNLPARERLAVRLLQLGGPDGAREIVLLQAQLAELVGVTRKTVSLVLRDLEDAGCVARTQGAVVIVNRDKLARVARQGSV